MERHERMRWYNPASGEFEWRKIPRSDEEVLRLLEASLQAGACKGAYREWRALGAGVKAALSVAGVSGLLRTPLPLSWVNKRYMCHEDLLECVDQP